MPKLYEIRLNHGTWSKVTQNIFNSWTGERRINGVAYTGPVVVWGS